MKIIVPSKGRAGLMTTNQVIDVDKVYVPESEVKDYEAEYKNLEIVGVPDSIKGITRTRNYILESEEDKHIVQIDDDVEYFFRFEGTKVFKIFDKGRIKLLFKNMFVMAEELGTNLWGLQLATDPKFYREYSPFSMGSIIVANLFGMINDGQRFDERFIVKEDYDYSLQSMYKHRKVFKNQKYGVKVKHLFNSGGVVSYRSRQTEEDAYNLLLKKWGNRIIKRNNNKNFVRVIPPIKGI